MGRLCPIHKTHALRYCPNIGPKLKEVRQAIEARNREIAKLRWEGKHDVPN